MASVQHTILHLHCISGVGPVTIMTLYRQLADVTDVYRMSAADIRQLGCSEQMAQRLVAGLRDTAVRDRELHAIARTGASYVTFADAAYPEQLRHITTPPPVVYYRGGSILQLAHCVAMIGSRKAGAYARQSAERIVPDVAANGYAIVSGGAHGADTIAHKAALRAGGVTAAVLGSGLGDPYPKQNRRLFQDIEASGGIVISPFHIDTQAQAHNFPVRNRVIAGLSQAIVVMQAAQRSGTHITASYALEAGRDVGAVPGRIDDPLSEGVHSLLRDGACLVASGADVMHMCGHAQADMRVQQSHDNKQESVDPVVALCQSPQQFDTLLAHTQLSFMQLQQHLMTLQLSGKVQQDATGCWVAC